MDKQLQSVLFEVKESGEHRYMVYIPEGWECIETKRVVGGRNGFIREVVEILIKKPV